MRRIAQRLRDIRPDALDFRAGQEMMRRADGRFPDVGQLIDQPEGSA